MNDREKLTEEAAKAMWAANGPEEWERATGAEKAEHLTLASAALAVFEKAHTPTDDEREALDYAIRVPIAARHVDHKPLWELIRAIQDSVLAAGFRRSEVPEPSVELIEEARRAKTAVYLATDASVADDLSRIIGGLADALEAAAYRPVPHGEPSDAQVEHVAAAIFEEEHPGSAFEALGEEPREFRLRQARAALRAAGGVR